MRLTGTWVGEYTYGPDYEPDGVAGNSVPFTMSLTESWLRKLVGYVRDDASRGGQPERGRIHGKRRSTEIEFVKTMPAHHCNVDGELIELREYYAQQGVDLPAELPPHRIHYRGTLGPDGETLQGEWQIVPWAFDAEGKPLMLGTGTWKARRRSMEATEV